MKCVQVKCPTLSLSPATFTVAAKAAVSAAGEIRSSSLTYLSVRSVQCGQRSLVCLQVPPSIQIQAAQHLTPTLLKITSGWQHLFLRMYVFVSTACSKPSDSRCYTDVQVGVTAYKGAVSVLAVSHLVVSLRGSLQCVT